MELGFDPAKSAVFMYRVENAPVLRFPDGGRQLLHALYAGPTELAKKGRSGFGAVNPSIAAGLRIPTLEERIVLPRSLLSGRRMGIVQITDPDIALTAIESEAIVTTLQEKRIDCDVGPMVMHVEPGTTDIDGFYDVPNLELALAGVRAIAAHKLALQN